MINRLLRNFYTKIYVSEFFARLQAGMSSSDPQLQAFLAHHNNKIDDSTANVNSLLEKIYDVNSFKKSKHLFWMIIIPFLLLGALFYAPLKKKYLFEIQQSDILVNGEKYRQTTLNDILALQKSLAAYYSENKSYPKSSGGWDAVVAAFGESKTDWIPGLAPKYISSLPVDPRKNRTSIQQYMYKSDGKNFKLIAHFPLGMEEVIKDHPGLVDPARPSWAFGVWTDEAKSW